MHFTVYVLYSYTARKHYTGFTLNLIERLKSHNELGKEWTARYRPWRIISENDYEMNLAALQYEKWLERA